MQRSTVLNYSQKSSAMNRVSLFEEYRLIERSESEVSSVWEATAPMEMHALSYIKTDTASIAYRDKCNHNIKRLEGAHLLLFFMAFVFGSFCTFCFHMLIYLFDEKCVLFPKLQSIAALKKSVIKELLLLDKDSAEMLPVDFLSSQWMEKSMCYLPTYVPLLSGIFGLVWTTMFLMCFTGRRTLTGLQRPWRVLPPVFIFSLAMGSLSIYSSAVTDSGLNELCLKLGEITGSTTCSYTVNVLTLAYERRIRGVYQAIRLTITAAWLHTICWLLSAALALARVVMAVDFQLVRVHVELLGDIDKMLEHHETQIRTVSPDVWYNEENTSQTSLPLPSHVASKVQFTEANTMNKDLKEIYHDDLSKLSHPTSEVSLVPSESHRLARLAAYQNLPKEKHFIVNIIYDLLQSIYLPESESDSNSSEPDDLLDTSISDIGLVRQFAKERLSTDLLSVESRASLSHSNSEEMIKQGTAEKTETAKTKDLQEHEHINQHFPALELASTSKTPKLKFESTLNITEEMRRIIESKVNQVQSTSGAGKASEEQSEDKSVKRSLKKSNLKHASVQTEKRRKRSRAPKVHIAEPADVAESTAATSTTQDADKETQTAQTKEKQD